MEDQGTSEGRPSIPVTAPETPPASERSVSAILEDEYFLMKTLGFLMGGGLHECRRVCHKWYRAVNQLPVAMMPIKMEELPKAVALFPKMTSVAINAMPEIVRTNLQIQHTHCTSILNEALVDLLLLLPNLQQLELASGKRFCLGSMEHYMKVSHLLRSLTLELHDDDINESLDIVRVLTSLTRLQIDNSEDGQQPVIEPLIELQKIQHLAAILCLTNQNGALLFPSLTNLTRLDFDENCIEHYNGEPLKAILPFASSLKRLNLKTDSGDGNTLIRAFYQLKFFTELQKLEWDCYDPDQMVLFCEALTGATALSSLSDVIVDDATLNQCVNALCSITGLKSLELTFDWGSWGEPDGHLLSLLTSLTELKICGCIEVCFVRHLTQLLHLSWRLYEDEELNLSAGLNFLPSLERLELSYCIDKQLPSCLKLLRNLKVLDLGGIDLDVTFFVSIASMEQLTVLSLGPTNEEDKHICLPYINCLTNLEQLALSCGSEDFNKHIVDGKLKRLKYLSLADYDLTEEDKLELQRKLPSLRRIISS